MSDRRSLTLEGFAGRGRSGSGDERNDDKREREEAEARQDEQDFHRVTEPV